MPVNLTRREFLTAAGLSALAPALWAQDRGTRPDIVVVMADDMGFSDLGCYGGEIRTPNLDALAKNGLRFTQFYNTARCCPSRASLLTGLYPHQAGIGHMVSDRGFDGYRGDLNDSCVTIAQLLKQSGYATAMSGKWHVTKDTGADGPKHNWPCQRGFDHYYGTLFGAGSFWSPKTIVVDNELTSPPADHYYYTDAVSEHAAAFVRDHHSRRPDQPLFMYVAYTAPHWPLHAPKEDVARYRGSYMKGWDAVRADRLKRLRNLGIVSAQWPLSPRDPAAGDWQAMDEEKRREMDLRMAVYAAQVDRMDQGIGRILHALRDSGRLDNTLLLFLADNGGCAEGGRWGFERKKGGTIGEDSSFASYGLSWANASNTPFRLYKHYVHEGGISSPLIVHWPETIRTAGLRRTPCHIIDIMPTCLQAAGAAYPELFEGHRLTPPAGRSMLPVFAEDRLDRDALFWEHEGNRAVRSGNWKLVAKGKDGPWELYDLTRDRTETTDLARQEPAAVQRLAALWQQWAATSNVLPLCPSRPKRAPAGSKATHFQLRQGQQLEPADCPRVARRPFEIRAVIENTPRNGVIVAQGGSRVGYALYTKDGTLVFTMRSQDELTTVTASQPVPAGRRVVTARFAKDGTITLWVDGKQSASAKAPGLLYDMPTEGLQVGFDEGAAAGEYQPPNRFSGTIHNVTIDLEPPP
jgi:arylsulfatase